MLRRVATVSILVTVLVLVLLSGCGKSNPKNCVSEFLTLAQQGDYGAASALLSAAAKADRTVEEFTKAMQDKDSAFGKIKRFEYKSGFHGADQSAITFSVTRSKDGKESTTDVTFSMLLESGKWRIAGGF